LQVFCDKLLNGLAIRFLDEIGRCALALDVVLESRHKVTGASEKEDWQSSDLAQSLCDF
jgi:hypothetical protein